VTNYKSRLILKKAWLFPQNMADARYCIEYAKTGRSGCKKCKSTIEKGICRIGKITPNPFSDDGGDMKVWYHARCMFETLQRARVTTKKIESPADLEGFPDLNEPDKDEIKTYIRGRTTITFALII
jgi:DNA ligase-3